MSCDLNLLKTLPRPPAPPAFFFFFFAFSCLNAPPNIEIRQSNNTSTPWISPRYLFRAVRAAAAIPTHPRPQRLLLPHHPHHRLDLAQRI